MKLYIYDCNYVNEFLEEVETETPDQWIGCSTEVPYVKSSILGTSFAFNTETQQWDKLIDDWRGITLYKKTNSLVFKEGNVGKRPEGFIEIAPPSKDYQYTWNEEEGKWDLYKEQIDVEALLKSYENAIQNHIDEVAQARGYDNGYTCASYYNDKNARYASDAQVFKDWRSDIWVYVNNILNQYAEAAANAAATGELPTNIPSIENIINSLPAIEWEEL